MNVKGHEVMGVGVDAQTRCDHYHSDIDIIAIKFKCCQTYYPCYECHEKITEHKTERWRSDEHGEKAILCGGYGNELSIDEYLKSDSICPYCQASFNPGCHLHYHLYFE
jgi:uncharacterized CHY-type Zn-finger protein